MGGRVVCDIVNQLLTSCVRCAVVFVIPADEKDFFEHSTAFYDEVAVFFRVAKAVDIAGKDED